MKNDLAVPDTTSAVHAAAPVAFAPLQRGAATEAVNDGQWARVPRMLRGAMARVSGIVRSLRSLGPYVAIEVLLPGGSFIALALWAYRRRRAARRSADATSLAAAPRAPLRCMASCGSR
jgi:hypothetical protein